ncbi:MAG: hypothetical protein BWY70_01516 [Bacteroidetes bacterium ADurb.Bin408]|nr:MAG: hypothetical protein BWY70_01516 [Bacteroidetes bacterium ADurb.Bin408]
MSLPDKRIIRFIKKHHLLTLSTSDGSVPYAASCFYIYAEETNTLYFASSPDTKHIMDALKQPLVAGTIASETLIIKRIRGVQFTGRLTEEYSEEVRKKYIKRFPVALFVPFRLWAIELHFIKMTDNRLGFGEKIIWGSLE